MPQNIATPSPQPSTNPPEQYANDVRFHINGQAVTIPNPDPTLLLVDYLRSAQVGLTGTKHACGQGGCGSCTVMLSYVDHATKQVCNVSANSCLRPVVALDGMEVTTIEGLGSVNTEVSPEQYAIAKKNGSQCGYCTPGFVMNMHALLIERQGKPLLKKEIEQWFDGNICRCTGYRPILYAMMGFASDWTPADAAGTPECYVDPSEKVVVRKEPVVVNPAHLATQPRALHFQGNGMQWYRPLTVAALESLMAKHAVGNQLKLVFGNTSYGIPGAQPLAPTVCIDISQLDDLKVLKADPNRLRVGAGITYNQFRLFLENLLAQPGNAHRESLQALHYMAQHTAGNIVRNAASLGGNTMLVARNTHPDGSPFPSDLFTALAAMGTIVTARCKGKNEEMPILDFVKRYSTDKGFADGAILMGYTIPLGDASTHTTCYKVALRTINSHSLANTGLQVQLDASLHVKQVHFVIGGIDIVAFHAKQTEAYLLGKVWNQATLSGALDVLHAELNQVISHLPTWFTSKPVEGISNDYRRALVEGYFYRFFLDVLGKVAPDSVPAADRSGAHEIVRGVSKGTQHIQIYADELPVSLPVIKLSAFEQATGEAIYTHDIPVPVRGLFGSFVTSLRANATFTYQIPQGQNKPTATDVDGLMRWLKGMFSDYVDYITYKDIPKGGLNNTVGAPYPADPLFCEGAVTCYGQCIGLVLARTENSANSIAAYVQANCIAYVESAPILTIDEAIAAGSIFPPESYDDANLIVADGTVTSWALKTTPEGIYTGLQFETATIGEDECLVAAGVQRVPAQIHFYMESQSVIAYPGEHREVTVHSSTQSPDSVQQDIAKALGVTENNVSVKVKRLGGGYGGKCTRTPYVASPAAIAAKKHKLPVRIAMPRDIDTVMIGKRHPMLGEWNIAVVKDGPNKGKILGTYTNFYSNGGNTIDCSFDVMDCCILGSDNAYSVPNFYAKGQVCQTNLASNTAMRSYGGVQAGVIMEEGIEAAAHQLGMLPEVIREMNLYQIGDKTPYGQSLDYCLIPQVWARLKRTSDFDNRAKAVAEFNKNNRWKKRGISMIPLKYGLGYNLGFLMQGGAQVNVYVGDGSVLVQHGGVEMGQGIMTKIAQIAAETLNVPLELIHMTAMETSVVPNAISTGATSGTDLNGGAVRLACQKQVAKFQEFCATLRAKNGDVWCVKNGIDYWNYKEGWRHPYMQDGKPVMDNGRPVLIWNNIVSQAYQNVVDLSSQALYQTPGLDPATDLQFYGFTYSAACTEVEIDVLTGVTNVVRADVLYDIGKSINPAIDIGQIEGAFVMGLGYMTTEYWVSEPEGTSNPAGMLNTINTWTYKPPATATIPEDFRVDLFPRDSAPEVPENPNLLMSSKGVGEPPLVLSNSVFFAIKHAILAARQDRGHNEWFSLECPATVERIQQACLVSVGDLKY